MLLKDTIGIFPNALADEFCDELIYTFHQHQDKQHIGKSGKGEVKNDIKNTVDLDLMGYSEFEPLVHILSETANNKICEYIESFPGQDKFNNYNLLFTGTRFPTWQLQYYKKGEGHFNAYHTEGNRPEFFDRMFAVMYYLNDVEEGGQTEFLYPELFIKPTKGTFLVWPAPWPYIHKGHVPLSGDKYIVTTWALQNNYQ